MKDREPMRSKKKHLTISTVAIATLIGGTACADQPSNEESQTQHTLLAITSDASTDYVSIWKTPNRKIVQCQHDTVRLSSKYGDWPDMPSEGKDCKLFPAPSAIPSDSSLLAINAGAGQRTQEIWETGGQTKICSYPYNTIREGTELDNKITCIDLTKPSNVPVTATITDISGDNYAKGQSFWTEPNGTITACEHKRVDRSSGFTSRNELLFQRTDPCHTLPDPSNKLPNGLTRPSLKGATANEIAAFTIWQKKSNGALAICDSSEKPFSGNRSIGTANKCVRWHAPKIK